MRGLRMVLSKSDNSSVSFEEKKQYGDFQTPYPLALEVCHFLKRIGVNPDCIVEPTCGKGSFLLSASQIFEKTKYIIGYDVNSLYIQEASDILKNAVNVFTGAGDFFQLDWDSVLQNKRENLLILGNPPWVTNSSMGSSDIKNLPVKKNIQNESGIQAITGKANFDISEWMILEYLKWLEKSEGYIAVLCKSAVARKVISRIFQKNISLNEARIYPIDAKKYFRASVDACLLFLHIKPYTSTSVCKIYKNFSDSCEEKIYALKNSIILSSLKDYDSLQELHSTENYYQWRSGIKHDCAKIMEIHKKEGDLYNGFNERILIEKELIFPLLKSSDIANDRLISRKFLVVTQNKTGASTGYIKHLYPKTWMYLKKNADLLNKRKSSIYNGKPEFSIFGIGEYSFLPWKIAISSLYKRLNFVKIGNEDGKPVMVDDTVYFIGCQSEKEADFLLFLLNSQEAKKFYESMIFWDDKRPITIEILKRLNLEKLSQRLGYIEKYKFFTNHFSSVQLTLVPLE